MAERAEQRAQQNGVGGSVAGGLGLPMWGLYRSPVSISPR